MPAPRHRLFIDRVVGGTVRRALDAPGLRQIAAHLRRSACERHKANLPPASPRLEQALQDLEEHGVFVASIDKARELGCRIPNVDTFFEELERMRVGSTLRVKASDFEEITPLYLAGLDPLLLELAERYIGLPPLYLGVEAKVEFPDGLTGGTRNWHWDLEDVRVLKIVLFASAVGRDDGPLECLSAHDSAAVRSARTRVGIHCDSELDLEIITYPFTGPAGTAIFFDGARLLHRVKPPIGSTRRSVMFSYASRRPRQVFAGARPSTTAKKQLRTVLTEKQMSCIP